VAHYIQSFHLVSVLDELRDAYELCRGEGPAELQPLLLQIRRKILEALHESLTLYSENAELHQQLSEAHLQLRHLRAAALTAATTDGGPLPPARKLS
jgi:hypothetical protein